HLATEVGIHIYLDRVLRLGLRIEEMPELARGDIETRDLRFTAVPADGAAIGKLAAAAGIERRLREHDPARLRLGDDGFEAQRLGMFMTVEMHPPSLRCGESTVLVEIAQCVPMEALAN